MQTNDSNEGKFYFKMKNGDYRQIGKFTNMNLEIDDNNSDDKILIDKSILQEKSISLKINKKEQRKFDRIIANNYRPFNFINNWRKMHHIPLLKRHKKLIKYINNSPLFAKLFFCE